MASPTHTAVVTPAIRAKLIVQQQPTIKPEGDEVRMLNEWTAASLLSLHQADGGLLVQHPQLLGGTVAGTIVEVGPNVKNLRVNDKVFGYGWKVAKEKAAQDYVTIPEYQLAKLPSGFTLPEAVTIPDNFVTALNTYVRYWDFTLPWPKPADYVPEHANTPLLIWGGSSSSGQFSIQVLRYYGYSNVITTASKQHHETLKKLGAAHTFDYREADVAAKINAAFPSIPFIMDCIGSQIGSLEPISRIAQKGSKVAILLPVILKEPSETQEPEYAMDTVKIVNWAEGVETLGVRTHQYLDSQFLKDYAQPVMMPALLASGDIVPNKQLVVEGATMLDRAQKSLDIMRRKEYSGERLVWRVSDLKLQ